METTPQIRNLTKAEVLKEFGDTILRFQYYSLGRFNYGGADADTNRLILMEFGISPDTLKNPVLPASMTVQEALDIDGGDGMTLAVHPSPTRHELFVPPAIAKYTH